MVSESFVCPIDIKIRANDAQGTNYTKPSFADPLAKGVATPLYGSRTPLVRGSRPPCRGSTAPLTRRSESGPVRVICDNPIQKVVENRDRRPETVFCDGPELQIF